MSHNLNTKKNGQAAVMYVGESAWHKLGTQLSNAATAEEAINHGGLDWEVVKAPLIAELGDGFADVPNFWATIRKDTSDTLGVVGNGYTIVQNREAFSFFDALVERDEAIYHSAGVIGKGEKIWVQAKMPEYIRVGKDDLTEMYVTLYNSHNGQGAVKAYITPIRIVCENTLRMSLGNTADSVSIRHTANVDTKIKQAAEILGLTKRYAGELETLWNDLAGKKLSKTGVDDFLKFAFPVRKDEESNRTINNRQRLLETIETGRGQAEAKKGTAWWLVNGYTRFLEDQGTRDKSKEVDMLLTGTIHRQRQEAFEYVMAL